MATVRVATGQLEADAAVLRRVVVVHAALASRWSLLPLCALSVSGSLAVSTAIAGSFCGWTMLVLLADGGVVLATTGSVAGSVPVYVQHMMFEDFSVGCRIRLATTAVGAPLTAALILSRSPIAGAKLGLAALGYFGLVGGLALARSRQADGGGALAGRAVLLYTLWAAAETILGLAASYGLKWAGSSLLSDEFDMAELEWRWLDLLMDANWGCGWLSLVLQLLIS
jgi:hypothetical protein